MHKTDERLAKHLRQELEDIVFTEAYAKWVHHLHVDELVITTRVANRNVHQLMVDDGSVVDILYLDAYKKMGLTKSALSVATSPLYRFMRDHIILKGMSKIAVTVGKHPQAFTVVADFLMIDCSSVTNGKIERPLLKALKVVTSIYHLTMKFSTIKGTGEVRGSQYD